MDDNEPDITKLSETVFEMGRDDGEKRIFDSRDYRDSSKMMNAVMAFVFDCTEQEVIDMLFAESIESLESDQ